MNKFADEIKKCTLSYNEVFLTDAVISKLQPNNIQKATDNASLVKAYYFTYNVNGDKISGYIVHKKGIVKKSPVIIYNRGGTGDFGIVKPGNIFDRIASIVRMGYVVIGSNYPGNTLSEGKDEHGGESDKHSVIRLYDIINALSICDANRVGMYGESRGGIVTYQCIQSVDWIKACLTVGSVNNLRRSIILRPEMKKVYAQCFNINDENELDRRSVIKNISKINPTTNICVLHGSSDQKVSPLDALELGKSLQENRINYSLHILSGGNHMLSNYEDELNTYIDTWFSKYL